MTKTVQICAMGALLSTRAFAGSWSGMLVDSGCYEMEERNVTLKAEEVNHDRDFEIRQCAPKAMSKSFAVVQQSGEMFKLDSAGNAKAAELVRKTEKKSALRVTVSGEMSKATVKVDSIVLDH